MMRPFLALILAMVAVLSACGLAPPGPSAKAVEQCSAQAGFTQRSDAARASGQTGRIDARPKELAAINSCLAGTAATGHRRACSKTLVGGTGMACSNQIARVGS